MFKFYTLLGFSLFILVYIIACHPRVTMVDFTDAKANYDQYCADCHGEQLAEFVNRTWVHGNTKEDLIRGIRDGYDDEGMPSFGVTFTDKEIEELALYILDGIQQLSVSPSATTQNYRLEEVVTNLDVPWGMAFLPNGDLLVTERDGQLYRFNASQTRQAITGVPPVRASGQGGLLDVELHPDFENNQWIYLSYAAVKQQNGSTVSTTAVMRAKLEGSALTEQTLIFEALPYSSRTHHYGSRLTFDQQGYLYVSVGDRGNRDQNPQSLGNHCGKIHRIHDDGRIPADNPFVNQAGAVASIYSYGHRNPQGMALQPSTGAIWTHEHGPKGGDEVNISEKGKNYGWPIISYGINYNGTSFTDLTHKDGMEQPKTYWVPSIAPCGATFVTGNRYPAWKGDFLVGSLKFDYVARCDVAGSEIVGQERLFEDIGRVRAIEMGRDGYIYIAIEGGGKIYRVLPE